ncbi:MAG: hypothetical protein NZM41_14125, partial [Saprospiraceae bacterium]|nr:hypothetical protein [Saprospiraceae bacterium]
CTPKKPKKHKTRVRNEMLSSPAPKIRLLYSTAIPRPAAAPRESPEPYVCVSGAWMCDFE